jgi:hypothetical protein
MTGKPASGQVFLREIEVAPEIGWGECDLACGTIGVVVMPVESYASVCGNKGRSDPSGRSGILYDGNRHM